MRSAHSDPGLSAGRLSAEDTPRNEMTEERESEKNSPGKGSGRAPNLLRSCIRCGSCAALCPTYREEGIERMGSRGRIALLKEAEKGGVERSGSFERSIFSCMLCGACTTVCPTGVDITDWIYEARKSLRNTDRRRMIISHWARLAFRMPSVMYHLLKLIQGVGGALPLGNHWPFKTLNEMGLTLPQAVLRDGRALFRASNPRGRIALFTGCTVNFLYPQMGMSFIRTLNAMRYDVILPNGEVCCGAPLTALGLAEDGLRMAERNVSIFTGLQVEAVVSLCPTCVHVVKGEYKRLLGTAIGNAMEATQFLADSGLVADMVKRVEGSRESKNGEADRVTRQPLTYHDPCHSLYHLKIRKEPREILRSLSLSVVEPKEQGCCGFAGAFRFLNQELSERMLARKVENLDGSGTIVTSCPNCVFQLKGKIKDRPVKHIVEIIGETLKVS